MSHSAPLVSRRLPPDDGLRVVLHDEVHARPAVPIPIASHVTYVAVLNAGVSRDDEWLHLKKLPGQQGLESHRVSDNFLRLHWGEVSLRWERHTEFTRYTLLQPCAVGGADYQVCPLSTSLQSWLAGIPGATVAAVELLVLDQAGMDMEAVVERLRSEHGGQPVAARLGDADVWVVTDFRLDDDGFERMFVYAPATVDGDTLGRIATRLLELETYRLMALRGLPVAKALALELSKVEVELSEIMAQMESSSVSEQLLLDRLIGLAARVERAMAQHAYRFSATRAYQAIVEQRMEELKEAPLRNAQTVGEFMRRRLWPAMATVESTGVRLTALSERVARTSALIRTRVDIITERQSHELLARLTKGQALQLRLQSTVEGLSIAAISYYVVSLLLYVTKALKSAGLPIHPEMAAGALVPLVMWGVWLTVKRIHQSLHTTETESH